MTEVSAGLGAGAGGSVAPAWLADPRRVANYRYWDGASWTAYVADRALPEGEPYPISWTPDLLRDPEPTWSLPLTAVPASPVTATRASLMPTATASAPVTPVVAGPAMGDELADPMVVAFGAAALTPEHPTSLGPRRRGRRVVPLVAAVAIAAIVGAAVASAGILSDDSRPQVDATSYRDASAGFALAYPNGWRVLHETPGEGVRFAIAASGAPTTETNTVSVAVGPTSAALPQLHTLAEQLTEKLRSELGSVQLDEASRTQLAGAPALHFAFEDPDATPPTRIEQYVGRTTAGRPLTITMTVREPRTAPTDAELRSFVDSITPTSERVPASTTTR